MPEGLPEIPAPFGKKPTRGKKGSDEGEFEVPKKSMGYMKKSKKYKEGRRLNVKKTVEKAAISMGLLIGAEAVAAWGGGPVEAIGVGAVIGPALAPHAIYEEKKKKVSEVI